ncbi:protein kinase [Acidobacteriota bacterium]
MKCSKCETENPAHYRYCKKCMASLTGAEEAQSSFTKTLEVPSIEFIRGAVFADRYEIIEELGKGGMGKVYRVEDKKIGLEIALKFIKPEIASDTKTLDRFSNELKTARMISHRNVCRMFDLGEDKGTHYITMEYVSGEDLKSFLRRSRHISIKTTIEITKQICEGLTEAHRLGVVHRDLKPSNIMIDKDGNVRIMDFGIARSLETKGITGPGLMIGTPEYMSPEQVEAKETDQRSDIYSLGVILYEMVTGQRPFEGDTPLSVAMKHIGESPKEPKAINSQLPGHLNDLILKCLMKDKQDRYQSSSQLLSELSGIEKSLPTTLSDKTKKRTLTPKEVTITLGLRKLLIPALSLAAVVLFVLIIWKPWASGAFPSMHTEFPSVAVLAFEDLSPQKDQGYLCDGIAESLITALSKVEDLRVPAPTSSFSFRGENIDIQEIGEKLNVKAVLRGSVQKSGNKVGIIAQLINIADESVLWSEQYNRELDDVFAIQEDINLAIVNSLKVELFGGEKRRLVKRYTEDSEAYSFYLLGRLFWKKRTEADIKRAIEYFNLAVEKDPNYALAYVGIAESYALMSSWGILPADEAWPKSKAAAEKALELDDSLAEAYVPVAGRKSDYELDWRGAERSFKRALKLNPNYPTGRQWYSELLARLGRFEEALSEMDKAQALDPLSLIISAERGFILYFTRDYVRAMQQVQSTLKIDPNFRPAIFYRGWIHIALGNYGEALQDCEVNNDYRGMGIAYIKMGRIAETELLLDRLINETSETYVFPTSIAFIYLYLGDKEKGFTWLEKAYEMRDFNMTLLKVDPQCDLVRSDPRFKAILKKVNLD